MFSFVRLMLLGVLYFQQNNLGDSAALQMMEGVISLLLTLYLMIGLTGIAISVLLFLFAGVKFLKLCISEPNG
jgi:hypothetical protein